MSIDGVRADILCGLDDGCASYQSNLGQQRKVQGKVGNGIGLFVDPHEYKPSGLREKIAVKLADVTRPHARSAPIAIADGSDVGRSGRK